MLLALCGCSLLRLSFEQIMSVLTESIPRSTIRFLTVLLAVQGADCSTQGLSGGLEEQKELIGVWTGCGTSLP